jgi:hypothetical protein
MRIHREYACFIRQKCLPTIAVLYVTTSAPHPLVLESIDQAHDYHRVRSLGLPRMTAGRTTETWKLMGVLPPRTFKRE